MYFVQLKLFFVILVLKVVKLKSFQTNNKCFHFTMLHFFVANSQFFLVLGRLDQRFYSLSVMDVLILS